MLCIRCIVRSVNLTFNHTSNYIRRIVIRCRPFRCNVATPNNTSNFIRGNVFSVITVHKGTELLSTCWFKIAKLEKFKVFAFQVGFSPFWPPRIKLGRLSVGCPGAAVCNRCSVWMLSELTCWLQWEEWPNNGPHWNGRYDSVGCRQLFYGA